MLRDPKQPHLLRPALQLHIWALLPAALQHQDCSNGAAVPCSVEKIAHCLEVAVDRAADAVDGDLLAGS